MQKKLSNLKNQYVRLMHKAECATGRKEAVKHFHNASKVADEIKLLSTWKSNQPRHRSPRQLPFCSCRLAPTQ